MHIMLAIKTGDRWGPVFVQCRMTKNANFIFFRKKSLHTVSVHQAEPTLCTDGIGLFTQMDRIFFISFLPIVRLSLNIEFQSNSTRPAIAYHLKMIYLVYSWVIFIPAMRWNLPYFLALFPNPHPNSLYPSVYFNFYFFVTYKTKIWLSIWIHIEIHKFIHFCTISVEWQWINAYSLRW